MPSSEGAAPAAPARPRPASSIASTGISRRASSGSRYSISVASSAASDSLSIRSARASGMRARGRHRRNRAQQQPGLRAAEQLVARAAHERRAGGERASQRRLVGQRRRSRSRRRARRSRRRRSPATPSPHSSLDRDLLDEPERPEVRLVHAQDRPDRSRRCGDRALVVARLASGWSCPTSISVAPDWAITSGIRKPPPISTSCPRETTIARPGPASAAAASSTAAAPLLTTIAPRRPSARDSSASTWLWRRAPRAGLQVELEVASSPRRRACDRLARGRGSGARPRLVCTITPVALITRAQRRPM